MELTYVDTAKIGRIFSSYNLTTENILDFLLTDDNQISYLLKLYLVSTIEDYKHITKLIDYVYCLNSFPVYPSYEIINRQEHKPFWELVRQRQDVDYFFNERIWTKNHLKEYYENLYTSFNIPSKEATLKDRLKRETSFIRRVNISKDILKHKIEKAKIKQRLTKSYRKLVGEPADFEELDYLISLAILNKERHIKRKEYLELSPKTKEQINELFTNYQQGTLSIEELKQELSKIKHHIEDNISFKKENIEYEIDIDRMIGYFILTYYDERSIIDFLKEDLVFNYYMITNIFNSDLLKEKNIEKLLHDLRQLMADYDISAKNRTESAASEYYGLPYNQNPLSPEYRKTNFAPRSEFFKNTPSFEDVPLRMHNLLAKYEAIKSIPNDQEYAISCYSFTQELLQIHPYFNGNGRTSKYLFYILLLKRNILPFTITDTNELTPCYDNSKSNQESYFEQRTKIMQKRYVNSI